MLQSLFSNISLRIRGNPFFQVETHHTLALKTKPLAPKIALTIRANGS